MRRFTLLLCAFAVTGFAFGQNLTNGKDALTKNYEVEKNIKNSNFKAGGDTIWSTTFDWADESQERGWSLPEGWEIGDDSGFGMPWEWRNDTIGGLFTTLTPRARFDTEEDGFMAAPIDEYNSIDGVAGNNAADTWFQTPVIDCSGVGSVVVTFWQDFRLCCSDYNLEMMVTNDDGVHWAVYDVEFGYGGNITPLEKHWQPQINISDVAAGLPGVQIRFRIHGPSHYYWVIDDLTLTEAFESNLVLEDTWVEMNAGYDEHIGHVNYIPLGQIGNESTVAGFLGENAFSGVLLNNGIYDQENAHVNVSVLKNGSEVFNDSSEPNVIWALERDTQRVVSSFLADDYGDYQFDFTAVSDNEEEVPENNTYSTRFTVNDTLYHRADFSAESSSGGGGWVDGNTSGDIVGVVYDLMEPAEINSITARIGNVNDEQLPIYQYVLYKYLVEEDLWTEWIVSDFYDADSTIAWTWQTHPIEKDGESEFLEPGSYIAGVVLMGDNGSELGVNGMSIGWDKDTKWPDGAFYSAFWNNQAGAWWNIDKLNQVGMNFNEEGGPTEAPVTFNVDMNAHIENGEFYPGSDFVDISGSFNDWGDSEHLTDADADGIYTITLDGLPVGEAIEFKYRINANWDTSEFPDGGPNRTYTVRYWNVLNHTYNGGETTGVEDLDLVETFNVYPNPAQGDFTVVVTNSRAVNMTITLMDIQGHVVYSNEVSGVTNHTETISNDFSKGIYFLTVNTGTDVKVQKIILK